MNLILSDVEETIMIVDVAEGASDGQGTINVGFSVLLSCFAER
jgi:U6 snRNA-associated Sm-like protein LSm3